jgi:hypothetical protein
MTMTDLTIDQEAEAYVASVADSVIGVRDAECLFCYVARMLGQHGCDTSLRFARHYRDQRAPRATAVERRMGDMGGYCDCEIFLNGMTMARSVMTYDDEAEEWSRPAQVPACRGVRRGSTKSCGNWERRRRWDW